jgi:predicted nuclease of restriction endonuclease-like RecB superfamily
MIRSEHSIVEYDFQRLIVVADRLHRSADADHVPAAKRMLRIYRDGIGDRREELHGRVEACLGQLAACPPRRIAAFCKLLDDQSQYESKRRHAADLRRRVFELAADRHPIVETREGIFDHELHQTQREIAQTIGRSWPEIEASLFSDVLELQRLESFDCDLEPEQLLSLYNLAQTQAALYRATRVRIDATHDFKTIIRHAKLAGLMHRVELLSTDGRQGYRFILDGPQANLRETSRYGIRFASLIPKLLTCQGWQMTAEILGPRRQRFRMNLSDQDGLRSVLKTSGEYDSGLESEVDAAWQKDPVGEWEFRRESQLLVQGQTVMTPDFTLHHRPRDIMVYIEAVGFWTPQYLEEKCRRLQQFAVEFSANQSIAKTVRWLLIVPKDFRPDHHAKLAELQIPIVRFDKKSKPKDWIDAIEN